MKFFSLRSSKKRPYVVSFAAVLMLLLTAGAAIWAMSTGPFPIPLSHLFTGFSTEEQAILLSVRLPRVLMALLVGGALAFSGVVVQVVFRNPIAEPNVLGVSAGASLGAVIAIISGFAAVSVLATPLAAFIGALVTVCTIYLVARSDGFSSLYTILLVGVAISAFTAALISLLIISVADLFEQRQILFWLIGGLDTSSMQSVLILSAPVILSAVVLLFFVRDFNLLLLGDSEAQILGARVAIVRAVALVFAALATGSAVAFTGNIGFVGLIIPNAIRLALGQDNRIVLPFSIIGGGLFLLIADTVARNILSPVELRVGIVTALVGTPIFLVLLLNSRNRKLNPF